MAEDAVGLVMEQGFAVAGAVAFAAVYAWSVWAQITGGRRRKADEDHSPKK